MWWASAIIIWCSAVAADDLAVSDSSSFVANTNEGVQQPIQLVRPDGNGGLEVVPEGMEFLESLNGKFEVVGVLGTFHTGKSFLLNQLMGRMNGFELGPTVRPTTEGLWVWGTPLTEGSDMQVLMLDTEGMSAPGNTADYDAKIFAVSTLLCSHIIYNSVKIIDESSLEYLQVLARRAQLFSLKTLLGHHTSSQDLDSLVSFPPLTWVVEDFFQSQVDGETPTQWLHRLMSDQTRTGAAAGPGLLDIFPETSCHTLFLPATSSHSLQHLDALDASDLTAEYQEQLAALVSHLISSLRKYRQASHAALVASGGQAASSASSSSSASASSSASSSSSSSAAGAGRGRQAKSGPALAGLLRVVVQSANSGSMAQMPELWALFMKDQAAEARTQAARLFDKVVASHAGREVPMTSEELAAVLQQAEDQAAELFEKALFGATHEHAQSRKRDLYSDLKTKKGKESNYHVDRIRNYIDRVVEKEYQVFDAALQAIVLPKRSRELAGLLDAAVAGSQAAIQPLWTRFDDPEKERQIRSKLDSKHSALAYQNSELLNAIMTATQTKARAAYARFMQASINASSHPLGPAAIQELDEGGKRDARRIWETEATLASEEANFKQFVGALEHELNTQRKGFEGKNDDNVHRFCKGVTAACTERMQARLHGLTLPLETAQITDYMATINDGAQKEFQQSMDTFQGTKAYRTCFSNLQAKVESVKKALNHRNLQVLTEKVTAPLQVCMRRLKDVAASYWFQYSFRSKATSVAEEEIGDALSPDHRRQVIATWVSGREKHQAGSLEPYPLGFYLGVAVALILATVILAIVKSGAKKQKRR